MRIGIDARFYGSIGKGLGRYTQKLIEYLEDIDTENEYFIFLRRENFEECHLKNSNFHKVLADYQWYSFSEQVFFPLLLLKYKLDLVHFPHFNVPVLYWRRFVVTIHDLILIHFPTQKSTTLHPLWYRIKFLLYKFVIWNALYRSKHVLTVSEFTKKDILKHYSISSEKITVSYEASDAFCFYRSFDDSIEILRKYNLFRDSLSDGKYGIIKPYLLYVGNAYPHKNLEALVETIRKDLYSDITLVLVGKEDYFYRQIKDTAGGSPNVIFTGFVPDDELDVLYRFGRAYVFPSLYEGFGLPPLEAMNKGLPVLCAYATSMPEILGDAALYFHPDSQESFGKKLLSIWNDEFLREKLRKKGYSQVKRFCWQKMARESLSVYKMK